MNPLWEYDEAVRNSVGIFCGTDEAGRGPLAEDQTEEKSPAVDVTDEKTGVHVSAAEARQCGGGRGPALPGVLHH